MVCDLSLRQCGSVTAWEATRYTLLPRGTLLEVSLDIPAEESPSQQRQDIVPKFYGGARHILSYS